MKPKKFKIDSDIANEFINLCRGDKKLAEEIINQVLRGYVTWQSMKLDLENEEEIGIKLQDN